MISKVSLRNGSFFRRLSGVLMLIAVACAIVAVVVPITLQSQVNAAIKSRTLLSDNTTLAFRSWSSPSQPARFDVWAFNITNPAQVLHGEKANLQEIGPLTYELVVERFEVEWSTDRSTLRYKDFVRYIPVGDAEELSNQNITTINFPFMGLAGQHIDGIYLLYNCSVNSTANCLFTTRPIKDILFGYNDSVLDLFGYRFPGFRLNFTTAAEAAVYSGHSRIYTGEVISQLARRVVAWDGMASLNCCNLGSCGPSDRGGDRRATWLTEEANQFQGSFGDQWPPLGEDADLRLQAFLPELYRAVPLERQAVGGIGPETVTLHSVPAHTYTLAATPFMNATTLPGNDAFYANGPNGILNITNCAFRANIYVSKPHFLGGDSGLLANITGVTTANATLHETIYDVEPLTGATLRSHKRVQFNSLMRKTPTYLWPGFDFFPNVTEAYVPVLWFDEHTEITPEEAEEFVGDVLTPLAHKTIALWCGIAGAIAFTCAAVVSWRVGAKRQAAYDIMMQDLSGSYVALSLPHERTGAASPSKSTRRTITSPQDKHSPDGNYGTTSLQ